MTGRRHPARLTGPALEKHYQFLSWLLARVEKLPRSRQPLFEQIASFSALRRAALRAIQGKRRCPSAAAFMAHLEPACLTLERALYNQSWRPGDYTVIHIRDPKPRRISAAPFRDRVVHHALCAEIEPIFERGFIKHSYANRVGKGTHRGVEAYERYRDRAGYVLRADIYRYFPAIDHQILKADIRRRIRCSRTLWLIDAIIDGSNPQEPVHTHYPGDNLLTPLERKRGLPIGNLTSQFFANVYLNPLDHFVKERLRCRGYVRYVDDFALFHDDADQLAEWRSAISAFLAKRRLSLHPRKTKIARTSAPATFLGYDLRASGVRRLPADTIARFRNRLRGLRDRWRAGTITEEEVRLKCMAWIAHAEMAHTEGLRRTIFRDGWFAPETLRLSLGKRRRRSAVAGA